MRGGASGENGSYRITGSKTWSQTLGEELEGVNLWRKYITGHGG